MFNTKQSINVLHFILKFINLNIKIMKKFILFLICSFIFFGLNAQITGYEAKSTDTVQGKVQPKGEANVNMKIDQAEATFPGGNDSLFKVIYSKLVYPQNAVDSNLQGEILLSFNVNFDGKVSRVSVVSGVGHGVDELVVEIIKGLIFEPAKMNGVAFRSQLFYTIPVAARSGK